jgi:hypothetical protein
MRVDDVAGNTWQALRQAVYVYAGRSGLALLIYLRQAIPRVVVNWPWLVRRAAHGVIENMNLALARNTAQNGLLPTEIV